VALGILLSFYLDFILVLRFTIFPFPVSTAQVVGEFWAESASDMIKNIEKNTINCDISIAQLLSKKRCFL
jgi:hypothetical protein